MVFGVPPLIVYAYIGLIRATYSNLKEAWAGFWDATMSPAYREWRDFWTWQLLPEFEDDATIRSEAVRLNYDMSQVSALQDDVDAIQTRARSNYQAGLINQNEARDTLGYTPTDGGDETYFRAPAPIAAAGAPAALDIVKGRKAIERKATRQQIERKIEKAVHAYLVSEYDAAASHRLTIWTGVLRLAHPMNIALNGHKKTRPPA